MIETNLFYGFPRQVQLNWKLLLATSYNLATPEKERNSCVCLYTMVTCIRYHTYHKKYVLNCLSKPFCLLSSSEGGSGASTPPESNGSENSTTKQIKSPVLFQKPFYTCFIKTLVKSRKFYFNQLLLTKVISQSLKIGFVESNSKFLIFYVNFYRHL